MEETLSWEEQKKRRNRAKDLPARRDKLLKAVEIAEARKKEIHERYEDPDFYMKTPAAELSLIEKENEALGKKIADLMNEWEQIEKEIEESAAYLTP